MSQQDFNQNIDASQKVLPMYSYSNITTQTTTTVKSGKGALHTITLNKPTATGVITIYDSTTATGTIIATITTPTSPLPVTLDYDILFTNGLTILTATADQNITISYI